ncbi:MAG: ABC transporter ATP-binding protein, partial [Gammaproteobacteria bacterium]|nr:ABC transporter ATP-binding protein [Gammaproteobacteria bacterium]
MTLLSIQNLDITFRTHDGDIEAVKNVSFDIQGNECLGIVGESGSGKSQTMFAATGLLAPTARTRGSIQFQNTELLGASAQQMQAVMGKEIGMIFQDPLTSLTPHLRVIDQLTEVLHTHGIMEGDAAEKRALEMLDMVRINEGARRAKQYPHELSGGMRQRVMIAMALACHPKV